MKLVRLALICFCFFLILSSCASNNDEKRYTGIRADEIVVSSIRQEIKDKENSLLADENDVFWTESSKIWHKSIYCSYLSNSKVIIHGTVDEAKLNGKEKGCERCWSNSTDSIYEFLEGNEYLPDDVFFTKEDVVWHTDINCSEILGAQKIYFANIDIAKMLGKLTACNECAD